MSSTARQIPRSIRAPAKELMLRRLAPRLEETARIQMTQSSQILDRR